MKRAVIITGTNGGIGSAIKQCFSDAGYIVIGIGLDSDRQSCDHYLQIDFSDLAEDLSAQKKLAVDLLNLSRNYLIKGLINNAAVQILGGLESLCLSDFKTTLAVNVCVPFLLSKICFKELAANKGSIINIGSIHAKLTKAGFIAYATSKGALETMTKAMAVDVGGQIRVNLIAPAAIETDMLRAGFFDNPSGYEALKNYHPTLSIGQPKEIALLAYRLIDDSLPFLNGSIIDVTGGISSKLYDPN